MRPEAENKSRSNAREVFLNALERSPAERGAFLDRTCAGNHALRAEVDELLREHDQLGDFLDSPAFADTTPGSTMNIDATQRHTSVNRAASMASGYSGSGPGSTR